MKLVTAPCIFLVIFLAIQEIEVTSKLTSYQSLLKVRLIFIDISEQPKPLLWFSFLTEKLTSYQSLLKVRLISIIKRWSEAESFTIKVNHDYIH